MLEAFLKWLVILDYQFVFRSQALKRWLEVCACAYRVAIDEAASFETTGQQVSCKETGQETVTKGHGVSPEKRLTSCPWGEGAVTRESASPGLGGGWVSHRSLC